MNSTFMEIFYVAVAAWLLIQVIGAPLTEIHRTASVQNHDDDALLDRKDMVLKSLGELQTDFEMGKIREDEYHALRADLESEAMELLRLLDKHSL